MSANAWMLLTALLIVVVALVALRVTRRSAARRSPARHEIRPAPERTTSIPFVLDPPPEQTSIDPAHVAARDMARGAYDIAQHLGFEGMPDRSQPSLRELRIPLRNELEREAAALLARGAHPCISGIEITRDHKQAITLVDLAAPPPT